LVVESFTAVDSFSKSPISLLTRSENEPVELVTLVIASADLSPAAFSSFTVWFITGLELSSFPLPRLSTAALPPDKPSWIPWVI